MTIDADWSNIHAAIDVLKHQDSESETAFFQTVALHTTVMKEFLNEGLPPQETLWDGNGRPFGVPAELAEITVSILQYCADNNIDLVRSLAELKK